MRLLRRVLKALPGRQEPRASCQLWGGLSTGAERAPLPKTHLRNPGKARCSAEEPPWDNILCPKHGQWPQIKMPAGAKQVKL